VKRRKQRDVEGFSLSFLDCICCGFGAIILLLVLSEFGQPLVLEQSRRDLEGQLLALQEQLHVIRGESEVLNRELQGRVDQLERERLRVARLAGELTNIRGEYSASRQEASVTNIVESELVTAYQTLSEEMKRLLRERPRRPPAEAVGGIPVDSEYIVFIIDTSGSMTRVHWDAAEQVLREILEIYPRVRGIQVMNDMGQVMIGRTRGQWMTDSPELRRDVLRRFKTWRVFSNSSPVEGIVEAIRTYWTPDKRISLYVIGDEFTGDSLQSALDAVAAVNKADDRGQRMVRIHAIGFPEGPGMAPFTTIRFAALMRLLCEQNNGTFVPLSR
jgi:hypothetical protein